MGGLRRVEAEDRGFKHSARRSCRARGVSEFPSRWSTLSFNCLDNCEGLLWPLSVKDWPLRWNHQFALLKSGSRFESENGQSSEDSQLEIVCPMGTERTANNKTRMDSAALQVKRQLELNSICVLFSVLFITRAQLSTCKCDQVHPQCQLPSVHTDWPRAESAYADAFPVWYWALAFWRSFCNRCPSSARCPSTGRIVDNREADEAPNNMRPAIISSRSERQVHRSCHMEEDISAEPSLIQRSKAVIFRQFLSVPRGSWRYVGQAGWVHISLFVADPRAVVIYGSFNTTGNIGYLYFVSSSRVIPYVASSAWPLSWGLFK